MGKIITNPDVNYVQKIIQGLIKKEGYCPCKVVKNEDTKCPCKDFRETNECCCKLYIEEENK